MFTLSKFVCPSTSKSPFKSEFPSITKPSATVLPVTLMPVAVVSNFFNPLWYKSTDELSVNDARTSEPFWPWTKKADA